MIKVIYKLECNYILGKWAKLKAVELIKGRYVPSDHKLPEKVEEETKIDDSKNCYFLNKFL